MKIVMIPAQVVIWLCKGEVSLDLEQSLVVRDAVQSPPGKCVRTEADGAVRATLAPR